ncbi:MAG: DUF3179 domain-containing (seleno)protein [Saprospiraceae bacterium]|nr:DUF3179 domain-containing (seleno)protein [Saprospiraceae bacterium]
MNIAKYLISAFILLSVNVNAQLTELNLVIIDKETNEPIENAHVFLSNTTYGTVSDNNGIVDLHIPSDISEDLIVSHLSYDLNLLTFHQYSKFKVGDSIYLHPSTQQLAEVEISSKISRKRKRQLRRFYKAFFGDNKQGEKCKVLNSEVLRFEESNGGFKASADDILKIENPFLGYKINYLLQYLKIEENGSIEFLGRSHYIDWIENFEETEIVKNRSNTYVNSAKHFFRTIIDNSYTKLGYELEQVNYKDGSFYIEKSLHRDSIFQASKSGKKFTLKFDNYLQIINKNKSNVSYAASGVRPGGLESTRFGTTGSTEKAIVEFQTSHLYKLSPYIILNEYGNVLNTKDIREYGYWAERKLAHQLPFDFGNNYALIDTNPKPVESMPIADEVQTVLSSQDKFVLLISLLHNEDRGIKEQTLQMLSENWENGFNSSLIEILRFSQEEWLDEAINILLTQKNGAVNDGSFYSWLEWLWSQEMPSEDYYFELKGEIYKHIDPKFESYFKTRKAQAQIRLDEVVWGGVEQDGIPPLRDPEMISADEAHFLDDDNVVFGFYINGVARAYPKRILAWHEFFVDDFENTRIAGVYCTLCGTVIAYDMTLDGTYHDLGTSGFLFRSNKLMYDKKTQSLWSTIEGRPVLGPLVNHNISLKTYAVVTSTWGKWKSIHPDTEVLSLNTGHQRDYNEGAAYADYFSKDELMFPVPSIDHSLKNKDEVFVIRADGYKEDPLSISIQYLKKKKWYQGDINNNSIIAIADDSGAARAYEAQNVKFEAFKNGKLKDTNGRLWSHEEECLISDDGEKLERISGHNIFWFAWYAAYPKGRLIK